MTDGVLGTASPRLRRFLFSNQFASWAGQGIVSATNFAILIILAHWARVEDVGFYALGYSILALAMVAQDSLVTRPYAIQMFKPPGGPEAHAYGTLVVAALMAVATGLVLAGASVIMRMSGAEPALTGVVLMLAAAAPLALTREFARRFSFANLQMHQALVLDVAASALIVALLLALALTGRLDAPMAFAAIGGAGSLCALVWFMARRSFFRAMPGAVMQTARQSWAFGKWLLASQITLQVQGYAAHWITALVAGVAATGVYSACLSIVSLSNPFLFGLFNLLTPKFVRILRDEGPRGLRREAFRDALVIGAIMGAFTLVLYLGGGFLLADLFPGKDFAGGTDVLSILALSSAVSALGAPATIALSASERGRAIAALSFGACVFGSAVVWLLLPRWGLPGAAFGMLATECLGTLARWALFLSGHHSSSPRPAPAPARH